MLSIQFDIIQSQNKSWLKYFLWSYFSVAGFSILYPMLQIFFKSLPDLFIYTYPSLVIMTILIIVISAVMKKPKPIGQLKLSEQEIIIQYENTDSISITELKKCVFTIYGFDGESPASRSLTSLKGNFNYMEIETEQGSKKIEFYIPDFSRIKGLKRIIDIWGQYGIHVTFNYRDKRI